MLPQIKVGDLVEIRNKLSAIDPKTGRVASINRYVGFVTALDDLVCSVITGGKHETFVLTLWLIRRLDSESSDW